MSRLSEKQRKKTPMLRVLGLHFGRRSGLEVYVRKFTFDLGRVTIGRMATRKLALELLAQHPSLSSGELARAGRVSRQAAHRQLRRLVGEGALVREGGGRGARYLPPRQRAELRFSTADADAPGVYRALSSALPALGLVRGPARELLEHALIELADNAITHAASAELRVLVELGPTRVDVEVEDAGVGVFESVRRALRLASSLEALLALAKGPVACDPARHRGESLWFVAKTARRFELEANSLSLWLDEGGQSGFGVAKARPGTRARASVGLDTKQRVRDALEAVTLDHAFARTKLALRLFSVGSRFTSRAEARRVLSGLERLSEVGMDFSGVEWVSQSFADEVFRVWASAHPETRLYPTQMNDDVAFVVRRALMPPVR